jgi:NTE family protein
MSGGVLGLALGGGAVLGAAHLGVLEVIEKFGLAPEIVTGTSVGALAGAGYALGMPTQEIKELALQATWSSVGRLSPSARLGLLDPSALHATVVGLAGGDLDIEEFPRRFGAVATDLRSRSTVVLDSGRLSQALQASIAIPVLFPPVLTDGQILVDGGMTENLPILACRRLGAERVIAVRLRPEWDLVPFSSAATIARLENEPSTLVIRPRIKGLSMWTMSDVPALIEAGRVAAEEALLGSGWIAKRGQDGRQPGKAP